MYLKVPAAGNLDTTSSLDLEAQSTSILILEFGLDIRGAVGILPSVSLSYQMPDVPRLQGITEKGKRGHSTPYSIIAPVGYSCIMKAKCLWLENKPKHKSPPLSCRKSCWHTMSGLGFWRPCSLVNSCLIVPRE
jgi:hypothetical protein